MAEDAVREDTRYWAFISYSHQDAVFGRRLHRRLESYSLPRRLSGQSTPHGVVPRRLSPIFRDREEFAAAGDLSTEIRAALQTSRSLVIVCSPASAASAWVAREIALFRQLHPSRPILAAIAEGEPPECFPPALRNAQPNGTIVEPLAADFRKEHDGAGLGLLKVVAGIVGIGLDELVQRDAQRKSRRVTAVTAAALAAVLTMGALTIFALNARTEAVHQRGVAEGLVEYMLTDLRDKLKGVGRLDIMGAVNLRALHYYADENLNGLPVGSLERRARILHAMGEDDETRGDHEAALKKFQEARRTTAALLAQSPNDAERIFDHAQSEFWVGYVSYERGINSAAKKEFLVYSELAHRAAELQPRSAKYLREVGYADGNLCSIMQRPPMNAKAAVRLCGRALQAMEAAAAVGGGGDEIDDDIVNRHAWLADAYLRARDIAHARAERNAEQHLLSKLISSDPKNMNRKADWIALQIALALLDEQEKRSWDCRERLKAAAALIDAMVAFDPANQSWRSQQAWIRKKISNLR